MMENKNIIWLVAIPVTIVFAVVSILLWFFGGNNKYLVSKKLKLGALIIGITGVMGGCRPPVVTCYKPAMIPQVVPEQQFVEGKIVIETGFESLDFSCNMLYDDYISWKILKNDKIIELGNCVVNKTDTGTKLYVDPTIDLEEGIYKLGLFNGKLENLGESQIPFKEFEFEVIKK
ncbi:MAG: hypothetical protein PHE56_01645 [Bacteroidales bacterium]|nr:hypothetical protein [Bacteroidales bacterium]